MAVERQHTPPAGRLVRFYDPDQPRDEHGRWGSGSVGTPEPAYAASQAARQDGQIADAAQENGMTPAAYRAAVEHHLDTLMRDATVRLQVFPDALAGILASGTIHNGFEVTRTAQTTAPEGYEDSRRALDAQAHGIPVDAPGADRPKFGWLGTADQPANASIRNYGSATIEFAPAVRDRTTFTGGDSLAHAQQAGFVPAPVTDPSIRALSFRLAHSDMSPDPRGHDPLHQSALTTRPGGEGYYEAQIHGTLTTRDIARVVLPQAPDPALHAALAARGVPYVVAAVGTWPAAGAVHHSALPSRLAALRVPEPLPGRFTPPVTFAPRADPTPGYTYRDGRYYDADGQVAPDAPKAALEQVITGSKDRLAVLAQRRAAGTLDGLGWRTATQAELHNLHLTAGALAFGGFDHLTSKTRGWIGARVRKQDDYLSGFALDVAQGKVAPDSPGFLTRQLSYADAARRTYQNAERAEALLEGAAYARNILTESAGTCDECEALSAEGWMPIEDMPEVGERACSIGCTCEIATAATLPADDDEGDDIAPFDSRWRYPDTVGFWDAEQHPRDEKGRFGSGDGAAVGDEAARTAEQKLWEDAAGPGSARVPTLDARAAALRDDPAIAALRADPQLTTLLAPWALTFGPRDPTAALVNNLDRMWGHSSTGGLVSQALQTAAADQFGRADAYDPRRLSNPLTAADEAAIGRWQPGLRAYLQNRYDDTQTFLGAHPELTQGGAITLYRGLQWGAERVPPSVAAALTAGGAGGAAGQTTAHLTPLSSWTTEQATAAGFASTGPGRPASVGMLLAARVAPRDILAIPGGGERETIVLGGQRPVLGAAWHGERPLTEYAGKRIDAARTSGIHFAAGGIVPVDEPTTNADWLKAPVPHAAFWDEAQHPRGTDGRFGPGDAATSGAPTGAPAYQPTPEERTRIDALHAQAAGYRAAAKGQEGYPDTQAYQHRAADKLDAQAAAIAAGPPPPVDPARLPTPDYRPSGEPGPEQQQAEQYVNHHESVGYVTDQVLDRATGPLTPQGGMADRRAVEDAIDTWNRGSAIARDTLQRAVAAEWPAHGASVGHGIPEGVTPASTRTLAQAMYANTQADLKANGIESVRLYRGMRFATELTPSAWRGAGDHSDQVVTSHPLSSWTTDQSYVQAFAGTNHPGEHGVILEAQVPASRIFSTQRTGLGHPTEHEFVVLGGAMQVRMHQSPKGHVGAVPFAAPVPVDIDAVPHNEDWLHPERPAAPAAFWDEEQHPRDERGRFGPGDGGTVSADTEAAYRTKLTEAAATLPSLTAVRDSMPADSEAHATLTTLIAQQETRVADLTALLTAGVTTRSDAPWQDLPSEAASGKEAAHWQALLDPPGSTPEGLKAELAENISARLAGNAAFEALCRDDVVGADALGAIHIGSVGEALGYAPGSANGEVAGLVHEWANTSNATPMAQMLQRAARDEFGLHDAADGARLGSKDVPETIYERVGPGLRAFVRAQYDETQAWLQTHGAGLDGHVTLYRGAGWDTAAAPANLRAAVAAEEARVPGDPRGVPTPAVLGGETHAHINPLSSFSTSPSVALSFTHTQDPAGLHLLAGARVPFEHILSTSRTGFGCAAEHEMVVLGDEPHVRVAAWQTTARWAVDADTLQKPLRTGTARFAAAPLGLTLLDDTRNADWPKRTRDLPPVGSPAARAITRVAWLGIPPGTTFGPDGLAPAERKSLAGFWDEAQHPRDDKGRFGPGDGTNTGTVSADTETAYRDRLAQAQGTITSLTGVRDAMPADDPSRATLTGLIAQTEASATRLTALLAPGATSRSDAPWQDVPNEDGRLREEGHWRNLLGPDDRTAEQLKAEVTDHLTTRLEHNAAFTALVDDDSMGPHLAEAAGALGYLRGSQEGAVAALVHEWAESSNNTPLAQMLQRAARDEFGLHDSADGARLGSKDVPETVYERVGTGLRAFVRAQYDETQSWLKEHGAGLDGHVTLYRGAAWANTRQAPPNVQAAVIAEMQRQPAYTGHGDPPSAVISGETRVHLNPLSSWSTNATTAISFTETREVGPPLRLLAGARVPFEHILSTSRTGFGCAAEREMVVLGDQPRVRANAWIGERRSTPTQTVLLNRLESGKAHFAAALGLTFIDDEQNADWPKRTRDLPPVGSPAARAIERLVWLGAPHAAFWDEEDHPRGPRGEFEPKEGGGDAAGDWRPDHYSGSAREMMDLEIARHEQALAAPGQTAADQATHTDALTQLYAIRAMTTPPELIAAPGAPSPLAPPSSDREAPTSEQVRVLTQRAASADADVERRQTQLDGYRAAAAADPSSPIPRYAEQNLRDAEANRAEVHQDLATQIAGERAAAETLARGSSVPGALAPEVADRHPTPEALVAFERYAGETMALQAATAGLTRPAYEVAVEQHLHDLLANADLRIGMTAARLGKVLKDEEFKTVFEVAGSGHRKGDDYMGVRRNTEADGLNIPKDAAPSLRPIYGELHSPGEAPNFISHDSYGDVTVELKSGVKDRSTFTVGDSLEHGASLPSAVSAPRWYSGPSQTGSDRDTRTIASIERLGGLYTEAQIHGGVRLGDIQRVVFGSEPPAGIARALGKAGIPVATYRYEVDAYPHAGRVPAPEVQRLQAKQVSDEGSLKSLRAAWAPGGPGAAGLAAGNKDSVKWHAEAMKDVTRLEHDVTARAANLTRYAQGER